MRAFIPLTLPRLRVLADDGMLDGPLPAYAVTPGLRDVLAADGLDAEELDEVARALAEDAAEVCDESRVVVAADVSEAGVRPGDGDGAVIIGSAVRIMEIAAVFVASNGDDADFLWFAPQELPVILSARG